MSHATFVGPHNGPSQPETLLELVRLRADANPEAIAIAAPSRAPLSYARLAALVNEHLGALNGLGIGQGDRVAVVLPNGPEMAVAFLATAAAAVCAPLNPDYRSREFEFFLADLRARAILLPAGVDSPARQVAEAKQIPVLEVAFAPERAAGEFRLQGVPGPAAERPGPAGRDDVALILHTSGTTARPKMVPLTHANLLNGATNVARSLALTPSDRCLNIMPLFHIHGLGAALLASLAAGASVVCTPGFVATRFFDWLDEHTPTWYTAVPTMHQSILARAGEHSGIIARRPLRLVRSCSSALPPQVMAGLEQAFGTPVIEAYGMTEASHQMASNPLPPRGRKPGSVGLPSGQELGVLGDQGEILPNGAVGEVVIRGPNVMAGYVDNPQANQAAFTAGWLRTGDQGYLDDEGYLFLTGRLKELINRGGEKVSPREVEEVLIDHPAVAQAVAFAIPDPRLGEDVAAAVVLRPGVEADERELRRFVAQRLAGFKVPATVRFLEELPKGPTGKLQRIGLAESLGLVQDTPDAGRAAHVAPRNPVEQTVAALWCEVLGVRRVGIHDRFLELGGDSLLATMLLARIRRTFHVELPLTDFFDTPTVEGQARLIEHMRPQAGDRADRSDANPGDH